MHSDVVLEDEKLAQMVFRHAVLKLARAAKISSELAVRLERRLPWLLARRSQLITGYKCVSARIARSSLIA